MPPTYLLVAPTHYDVSYAINPWMRPDAWSADVIANLRRARSGFDGLRLALEIAGGSVVAVDGVAGLPDMVFPANAGIVLDRTALVAEFRYPERQGETAEFTAIFERLRDQGVIDRVVPLPAGLFQEGAGDCIWDRTRGIAWAGYGPRSSPEAPDLIADLFGITVAKLELATDRFYHLDTCFCVLPHGEVFYYPAAFTAAGLAEIRARIPADLLIEATDEDAGRFCVNAVALDRTIVMAQPSDSLTVRLADRGYHVTPVDLAPFILSGGGAYCMTLRLDLSTR